MASSEAARPDSAPNLDILYEDGPVLAINKPSGLLTQAPPGIDNVELRVKTWLKARDRKPGNVYLGVPHRLDRPVTGVLVVARHVRATRRLAEQFEARLVRKLYWAVVETAVEATGEGAAGTLEPPQGEWRDWMIKVAGQPRGAVVPADHPEAREAVLRYRVLQRIIGPSGRPRCWLEIELETGRTHQIRVQAASRGWHVVGDEFYGATSLLGPRQDDPRLQPIALHARSIEFRHPMTQERVRVEAPLPAVWESLGLRPDPAGIDDPN